MKYFEIFYRHGKKKSRIILNTPTKLDAMKEFQNKELGIMINIKETKEPLSLKWKKIEDSFNSPIKNKRVNTENYVSALNQLAVMLDAGMPINICLNETVKSTQDSMLKAMLENIYRDVEEGQGLSDAFKQYAKQLGNLSISLVALGEQTGTLSESIAKLADILENIHNNRMKLKKATRYPLLTIGAMAIAFTVVITFVVPQFESIFTQIGTELPLPTLILLWLEYAIVTYGIYIIGSAIAFVVIYSKMYQNSELIALKTDKFMLKVYIVGIVTKYAMLGRFIYIFNILVKAGIPIVDAISAAIDIVDNKYMKQQFEKIKSAIEDGKSLHSGFVESEMFNSMILQMLKAGEDSGGLNKMLDKVALFYSKKYDDIIDNVSTMIEPVLIAAIAGFVLVLALGIFLPMWSMADSMM
ncbi:MAG: type II secretion system F family protein [Campylobacterota bacterium]|nr:type II secretion system F family protein [Campylobacterota bacterium]